MKKYILIGLFSCLTLFFLASCIFSGPQVKGDGNVTEVTRQIKGFEKVDVSRGLEVFLIPDSSLLRRAA